MTLRIPKRHWQPGRQELDSLICETSVGAYASICTGIDPIPSNTVEDDEQTSVLVSVKGGYEYEVVVRLVNWPGKEHSERSEGLDS